VKIAQEVVVRFDLTCGVEADHIALLLARQPLGPSGRHRYPDRLPARGDGEVLASREGASMAS